MRLQNESIHHRLTDNIRNWTVLLIKPLNIVFPITHIITSSNWKKYDDAKNTFFPSKDYKEKSANSKRMISIEIHGALPSKEKAWFRFEVSSSRRLYFITSWVQMRITEPMFDEIYLQMNIQKLIRNKMFKSGRITSTSAIYLTMVRSIRRVH